MSFKILIHFRGCVNIKLNVRIFIILSLIAMIFVLIGSLSAADIDANNTEIISANDDDEIMSVENDLDELSANPTNPSTFSELSREIGWGGDIELEHDYYSYNGRGSTIQISLDSVINGRGAVIDMAGSSILPFRVISSRVIFKNLTIKNANYNGNGGAIHFESKADGTVENCNFTNNKASRYGGAVYFEGLGNVTNCNFTNNKVSRYGGAVYFEGLGNVTNCNFTNNTASKWGGAVYFEGLGNVTNCNFTNNTASDGGGAIYFHRKSNVTNCNFTNNKDNTWGGAIYIYSGTVENCTFTNNTASSSGGAIHMGSGTVTNCNFTNNTAIGGGAISSSHRSNVTNCNFTNNTARAYGGAIHMGYGTVTNCNFTNNTARAYGGAAYFEYSSTSTVENCNFTNNTAGGGGAIYFNKQGNVTNCNFTDNIASRNGGAIDILFGTVENCTFTDNSATHNGSAIHMGSGTVTNCNFTGNNATTGSAIYFYITLYTNTVSNSIFLNNRANAEALEVTKNENNITITFKGKNNCLNAIYSGDDAEVSFTNVTYWGANGITNTGDSTIKPSRSNKAAGQNITVGVVVNDELVLNEVKVTDENGTIVLNINVGDNYYIIVHHNADSYYTEAKKAISNMTFSVNVTSQTTTNKTVNITAKSNIPNDIIQGKLLFILPYSDVISANYNADGTWWALYPFGDYGDYNVSASYIGLDEVTVTDGTIRIRANVPIDVRDISINFGDEANVVVGVPEAINGQNLTISVNTTSKNATVKNGKANAVFTDLPIDKYVITVNYLGDSRNSANSTTAELTVNKSNSTLTVDNVVLDYGEICEVTVTADGASGITAKINEDDAVVDGYTIKIPELNAGNYTLTVTTIPDDNHNSVTKTANITVNKIGSKVHIQDIINITYGDAVIVKYSIENRSDNVTVIVKSIDGTQVSGANIIFDDDVITIASLDAGSYTVSIINNEDKNTKGDESSESFNVAKFSPSITLKVSNISYGEVEVITITCDVSGSVNVTVGNITETLELNGENKKILLASLFDVLMLDDYSATLSLSNLGVGKYPVSAVFNGNENFESVSASDEFEVNAINPTMDVKANDINVGDVETVTVTLPDDAEGDVTITVGDRTIKESVDNGKAVFKLSNLKACAYEVSVSYIGDNKYLPANGTADFKVSKVKPNVAVEDTKITDGEIVITLPDDATGSVTIEIDGESYTALVMNGKAVFNVPGLSAGKHDIKVYYSGDEKYDAAEFDCVINVESNYTNNHEKPTERVEIAEADVEGNATGNPLFVLLLTLLSIGTVAFKRFKS